MSKTFAAMAKGAPVIRTAVSLAQRLVLAGPRAVLFRAAARNRTGGYF